MFLLSIAIKVNFEEIKPLNARSNEAYKMIRTNVAFCGRNIKTIVVTSTACEEGKTMIAFNLAKSFTEAGKKVVFVDADLRKSTFLGRYPIDRAVRGLTHYLSGIYGMEDIIYRSNIHNLSIVFAGPKAPNPPELLGNQKASALIGDLREQFDYVIIDTPPLGNVIDSALIAAKCDGAIVVIETERCRQKEILEVEKQLKKAGCRILGAVLNKVDTGDRSYYGRYLGHYYKRHEDYYEQVLKGRKDSIKER